MYFNTCFVYFLATVVILTLWWPFRSWDEILQNTGNHPYTPKVF